MLDAMGEVLPAAMGVALSPFPIIAVVLTLGSARPTANGSAFAAGWVLAMAAITALAVALTGGADDTSSDTPIFLAWVQVVLGFAVLALAVGKWRSRPRPGDEPVVPGWMATLDDVTPPRALVLGAALGGANPKNLAFTFAAATSIGGLGLEGADAVAAGGVYVALASSTVLATLGAHVVAGSRSEPALAAIKEFMLANNAVIMMIVLLVIGAKVLGDGLAGI